MDKYILDTNIFFNMTPGVGLGKKTEQVVMRITQISRELKKEKKAEFFMPPSAVSEFLSFFEEKKQPFIENFLSTITIKSPDYGQLTFPAFVFYQLINEVRQRNYRGLNIAEEEINKAGRLLMGKKNLSKKDFQIVIGPVIKNFRERYRQATRIGFLDSATDLDLIVLAKELNGFLVSADEGVLNWGRIFGVKELPVEVFGLRLREEGLIFPHQEEEKKTNQ